MFHGRRFHREHSTEQVQKSHRSRAALRGVNAEGRHCSTCGDPTRRARAPRATRRRGQEGSRTVKAVSVSESSAVLFLRRALDLRALVTPRAGRDKDRRMYRMGATCPLPHRFMSFWKDGLGVYVESDSVKFVTINLKVLTRARRAQSSRKGQRRPLIFFPFRTNRPRRGGRDGPAAASAPFEPRNRNTLIDGPASIPTPGARPTRVLFAGEAKLSPAASIKAYYRSPDKSCNRHYALPLVRKMEAVTTREQLYTHAHLLAGHRRRSIVDPSAKGYDPLSFATVEISNFIYIVRDRGHRVRLILCSGSVEMGSYRRLNGFYTLFARFQSSLLSLSVLGHGRAPGVMPLQGYRTIVQQISPLCYVMIRFRCSAPRDGAIRERHKSILVLPGLGSTCRPTFGRDLRKDEKTLLARPDKGHS
ncbi:hypothetical protein EVAR_19043_1 [Eumeta japonica]|uniref:Uncharacterized protein n=1 Tax=Eumeta variegata TaxID=151549 RepID=A0A4C1V8L1_EUMVA|nr:hypothetical protein EVAR_19043_1 [Eumeta japonica]